MLIPSGFIDISSKFSSKNGAVVMGGDVSNYISSLAQLGFVKMCGHSFYTVSRYVSGNFAQTDLTHATLSKGTQNYEFLIASLPMSTHLAVVVRYAAANHTTGGTNSPVIDLDLLDGSTTIDAGIRFSFPLHLSQQGFRGRSKVFETHTPLELNTPSSGSHTSRTTPRPLFIPTANRGNVLTIEAEATDCNILAIDVFEVYQEVRTP